MKGLAAGVFLWLLTVVGHSWPATTAATVVGLPPQGPRSQGAKVTFERLGGGDTEPLVHSQRARLLSLAVERGETPTPFLPPGLFKATFTATVTLPARDRMRFRLEGRGAATLKLNGQVVLDGALRAGKPLETSDAARLKKGDNELELGFESGAMGDGQVRLFWSGSDFGFEPIPPERLSFPADDAAVAQGERLRLGQQLFADHHCARCHEFEVRRPGESAFAELDTMGPDLRAVGARHKPAWMAAWLQDPKQFRADATLPKLGLSAAECADLAAWLGGLGAPLPMPAFDAEAARRGGERFRQRGCVACHRAPGDAAADPAGWQRIPLAHVGAKWHGAALVDYLQKPATHYEHVKMPDLALSRDDAQDLAAYLLAAPAPSLQPRAGDAAAGRKVAQKYNCAVCHALDVPLEERRAPGVRNLKAKRGCLGEGDARGSAPDHGFQAGQREALAAFLAVAEEAPFRRAPLDYVQRHLTADRCVACHAFDGRPSTWAQWAAVAAMDAPLEKDQDPVAQGVPALTWVGSKLQPSWIDRFVRGEEKSPRPWLVARMPAFRRHGSALAQGLVREHGYGPQDEPPVAADAKLAAAGERLVAQGTGFGCVQCHALGDQPAVQVFEREGIELLTARRRLRHEYYTRWLADPPRLDPDSRMPKYGDDKGKTAFTDVLGGDAAQQFEAIWQFLGSRLPGPR